ncbi:12974_t:CDS:2 [Entrophospora sp. SA101]|nr:12974_t:CDS:2 [Entrophospora sp. SA101]
MCQQIIGKPQDWHYSDVVVAYGSGVFSSSFPGYASGPKNNLLKVNIRDIYNFMCKNGGEQPSQFVRS